MQYLIIRAPVASVIPVTEPRRSARYQLQENWSSRNMATIKGMWAVRHQEAEPGFVLLLRWRPACAVESFECDIFSSFFQNSTKASLCRHKNWQTKTSHN